MDEIGDLRVKYPKPRFDERHGIPSTTTRMLVPCEE
jgi:hypothetical protein